MRRSTTLAPALALALALAGCASQENAPTSTTPTPIAPVAQTQPVTLTGCAVVEALAKMPPDAVAPFLPDAFESSGDASGVFVILGGAACAEGGDRAYVAIQVTPTDERLAGEGIARYYWEPEHDVARGGAFAELVASIRSNVSWIEPLAIENGPTGASMRVIGEGWEHAVTTPSGALGPGASGIAAGVFREYFAADGGFGYLQAAFADDPTAPFALGPTTVTTGEGTIAREVFGPDETAAGGVGTLDYVDTVVGFVPWDTAG